MNWFTYSNLVVSVITVSNHAVPPLSVTCGIGLFSLNFHCCAGSLLKKANSKSSKSICQNWNAAKQVLVPVSVKLCDKLTKMKPVWGIWYTVIDLGLTGSTGETEKQRHKNWQRKSKVATKIILWMTAVMPVWIWHVWVLLLCYQF